MSKVFECLEQNIRKEIDAKDHQIPNKLTDYKIFELKYGNTKVKLVLAVFVSAYLYQYSIKLY